MSDRSTSLYLVLTLCAFLSLLFTSSSLEMSSSARRRTYRAVVDALKQRNKTLTTVESTTGGLISSSIMSVDGASSVFHGGSVAYSTKKCKPLLLNDSELHKSLMNPNLTPVAGESDGDLYKRSKLDWTSKTALSFCKAMDVDYCVAEGGASGPTFRPNGLESGFSAIAVAARCPNGTVEIVHSSLVESSHADREKNMELFSTTAGRELLSAVTNDGLNRRVELRNDPKILAGFIASKEARFVVVAGSKMLFASDTELALLPLEEAQAFSDFPLVFSTENSATGAFLGFAKGSPLFAFDATANVDDERFADTRTQAPFLDFTENQVALCATALITWHRNSKYCGKTGLLTKITQGGHCAAAPDGGVTFPRNDPAVIVAVSSRCNEKILLARSPRHPEKMFTTLAGFVEAGETFEAAVKREVMEEVRRSRGR